MNNPKIKEDDIVFFEKAFSFLSPDFPCLVEYQGIIYRSAQMAFWAQFIPAKDRDDFSKKSISWGKVSFEKVQKPKDYERKAKKIMWEVQFAKFSREPLKSKMLSTGNRKIAYYSDVDRFWGTNFINTDCQDNLGKILTDVRECLVIGES